MGFGFLDVGDLDDNADFYDEVHPKPRVLTAWATRLAGALQPLLEPQGPPETEPLNGHKYISSMPAKALPGTTDDNR